MASEVEDFAIGTLHILLLAVFDVRCEVADGSVPSHGSLRLRT